jgi:glycosyltransferase involved in cell wall biosynthesis
MACGLPVVATEVGGNAEVVCAPELGALVPFGDSEALTDAVARALGRQWDREAIVSYARRNSWDGRVAVLVEEFRRLAPDPIRPAVRSERPGCA